MRMKLILCLIILCISSNAFAQTIGESSGLPLPRFVSLRSDTVYARTGPGTRYPVKWVYQKENLPVEVIQEFDTWRKVRDIDSEEAWIHQSLLSGRRYGIIAEGQAIPLLRRDFEESSAVALIETGMVTRLEWCREGWCRVDAKGFEGFIHSDSLWGVYEGERIQ